MKHLLKRHGLYIGSIAVILIFMLNKAYLITCYFDELSSLTFLFSTIILAVGILLVIYLGMQCVLGSHLQHEKELEHALEQLRIAQKASEKANKTKSIFLSNITHELRTPLHVMLSFSEMGKQQTTTNQPQLHEYFTDIKTSGDRLLVLLNNLLSLTKLDAGKVAFDMQPHNIVTTLNNVIKELAPLLTEKKLKTNIKKTTTIKARYDQQQIKQLLKHVLTNAINYSYKNTEISITLDLTTMKIGRRKEDIYDFPAFALTISDVGIGIPKNELNDVFDAFTQSSRTHTGAGGTGLGLAICRQIVEAHKGTISAKNTKSGVNITIIMPLDSTVCYKTLKET